MQTIPQQWQSFTIRQMRPDEVAIVLHHRRSMFFDMGHTDTVKLDGMEIACRPFFESRLTDGRYVGFVAEDHEGKVIAGGGIIINEYHPHPLDMNPKRPIIVNVYTEKEYRRRGLARKLMEVMIEWCRDAGFGTLVLHASPEGRPLYESLGFLASNEMKMML